MVRSYFNFMVLPYVPNRFMWAFLISLAELYAIVTLNFLLLAVFAVLAVLTITTRYAVEINTVEGWYKEYVWVLGLKRGEAVRYSAIEYLFINKGTVSQTTSSQIKSTTVTRDEYRGFIKFDGNEKIHILTNNNQDALVRQMSAVARDMNARLIDYSSGQAIQIV